MTRIGKAGLNTTFCHSIAAAILVATMVLGISSDAHAGVKGKSFLFQLTDSPTCDNTSMVVKFGQNGFASFTNANGVGFGGVDYVELDLFFVSFFRGTTIPASLIRYELSGISLFSLYGSGTFVANRSAVGGANCTWEITGTPTTPTLTIAPTLLPIPDHHVPAD